MLLLDKNKGKGLRFHPHGTSGSVLRNPTS